MDRAMAEGEWCGEVLGLMGVGVVSEENGGER